MTIFPDLTPVEKFVLTASYFYKKQVGELAPTTAFGLQQTGVQVRCNKRVIDLKRSI